MRAGMMVKIHDIGPLAKCLKVGKGEALLELFGETFWCPAELIDIPYEEEMEVAA